MQVVYSGGTTTPTPSPRIQRKIGYSRPVMPGYNTHVQPQVLVQRSRERLTEGDTNLRDSIPLMSKSVATLCLVLNIFIPGSGTLTAGLSVLCCSKVRPIGGTKRHCIWMNAGVALIQFLLTFLFLLGWIWSITWGVAFLTISRKGQQSQSKAGDDHHRHRDGDKTHAKIYDTSKQTHPNSSPSHYTQQHSSATKPSRHNQQQHNHHHHHQHHHHSDDHDQFHADNLDFHHNNNKSHPSHAYDRRSGTPSPRGSPAKSRQETSSSLRPDGSHAAPTQPAYNNSSSNRSSSTSASQENTSSSTVSYQPIIVLQKAPEHTQYANTSDVRKVAPDDTIMHARTRHMKMLQRKLSDNDLSPFVLTNKQLEAIVIHDLPLVSPNGGRTASIDEETEGLPKMEMT